MPLRAVRSGIAREGEPYNGKRRMPGDNGDTADTANSDADADTVKTKYLMADEPVSQMQPRCIANAQVTDFIQPKIVNDVSFVSEVRILATTLPQFLLGCTTE
jgi:hypothetical protein